MYTIIDKDTLKLTLKREDKKIIINLFSIFDTSTFEVDQLLVSFDYDFFINKISTLAKSTKCEIYNGKNSISFEESDGSYDIEISTDNKSFRLKNVMFDYKKVV